MSRVYFNFLFYTFERLHKIKLFYSAREHEADKHRDNQYKYSRYYIVNYRYGLTVVEVLAVAVHHRIERYVAERCSDYYADD